MRHRCDAAARRPLHRDVSDTGPGIRADILPRLFEPFVTSKPPGTGLGLGLRRFRRSIVRAFGGSLRAPTAAGGGACFTVDLPLARTARARRAIARE